MENKINLYLKRDEIPEVEVEDETEEDAQRLYIPISEIDLLKNKRKIQDIDGISPVLLHLLTEPHVPKEIFDFALSTLEILSLPDAFFQYEKDWQGSLQDLCYLLQEQGINDSEMRYWDLKMKDFASEIICVHCHNCRHGYEAKAFALKAAIAGLKKTSDFYWNLFSTAKTPDNGNVLLFFDKHTKNYIGGTTSVYGYNEIKSENENIAEGISDCLIVKKTLIYTSVSAYQTEIRLPMMDILDNEKQDCKYYCLAENGRFPQYRHVGSPQEALLSAITEAQRLSVRLKQKVFVLRFLD